MRELLTAPTRSAIGHLNERASGDTKNPRWRKHAQRDHDRLLYSSAFQRLGGITQVTPNEVGRPFHTRQIHTLKVAQVARRSAERLHEQLRRRDLSASAATLVRHLDIDATEAAALAHDLGHPPFGHLAETVLNERAVAAGGFEGNAQSFRIVTRLGLRHTAPGLDLTRRTLNGMIKYPWLHNSEDAKRRKKWGAYGSDEEVFGWVRKYSRDGERSLEACLMDWADDITYAVHDADDFARAGLIPLDRLARDKSEMSRFSERLRADGDLKPGDPTVAQLTAGLKRALSHVDLAGEYEGRPAQRIAMRSFGSMLITRYIEAVHLESVDDKIAAIEIDNSAWLEVEALKQLTRLYVIKSPSLAVIQRGHRELIDTLWRIYFEATMPKGDRRLIPPQYRARLAADPSEEGRIRLATDLVAGMTEPNAIEVYRRVTGMTPGSVLDAAARGA